MRTLYNNVDHFLIDVYCYENAKEHVRNERPLKRIHPLFNFALEWLRGVCENTESDKRNELFLWTIDSVIKLLLEWLLSACDSIENHIRNEPFY